MNTPRRQALKALNLMRVEGLSLTRAADQVGLTRDQARKYLGNSIEKARGRWHPKPWDRLEREMRFLDPKGLTTVTVRDSRSAERVGRYWNAVEWFLQTGDTTPLEAFQGRTFQSYGRTYEFITNPTLLKRLGNAGEVTFENVYAVTGRQS